MGIHFCERSQQCAGLPRFLDASQISTWAKKILRTTKLRSFSLLEGVIALLNTIVYTDSLFTAKTFILNHQHYSYIVLKVVNKDIQSTCYVPGTVLKEGMNRIRRTYARSLPESIVLHLRFAFWVILPFNGKVKGKLTVMFWELGISSWSRWWPVIRETAVFMPIFPCSVGTPLGQMIISNA